MKSVANWYVRVGALVLILAITVAALACGGGGGSVNLSASTNNNGASASATAKSTGELVTESEIATLPAWQQELLSDSGWNQSFIEPRESTPIMAPTNEFFEEMLEKGLAEGETIIPRPTNTSKSASWDIRGDFDPEWSIQRGQYDPAEAGVGETPGYGCNVDHDNDYGSKSSGSDDPIVDNPPAGLANQRISYVEEGIALPNHFNGNTGGTGNDVLSCVYQLYCNNENGDPKDEDSPYIFAELAYRSDLGGGITTGVDCGDAEAFEVAGGFWRAFNRAITALPYGEQQPAYYILIAPSGPESALYESSANTTASYQPFYLGNLSSCYGGGMIVGISSTTSSCDNFVQYVEASNESGDSFFYRPIYGVLLRRWMDTAPTGQNAWDGTMGWPVYGPIAYSEGASTLTARGTYFAWGMWFERGFVWWIDYDQESRPTTPDEGQAYAYTGSNVYCKDGQYEQLSTAYYGGTGELAATVSVDGYRDPGDTTWKPGPFENNQYTIPLDSDTGLGLVEIAFSAHPYGGNPRAADCLYKHCTWAFRDGVIRAPYLEYDQDQFVATHTYGSPTAPSMENTYVVRVQVVDASNAKGYGDSYPIVIGHKSVSLTSEILIVRNDGGSYPTNYNAIKSDLDDLGVGYDETTSVTTPPHPYTDYKAVIWYHGGPDGNSETSTLTTWTDEDHVWDVSNAGVPLLLFSQAMHNQSAWWFPVSEMYIVSSGGTSLSSDTVSEAWAWQFGRSPDYTFWNSGPPRVPFAPHSGTVGSQREGVWGGTSEAGEGYTGSGSSGQTPNAIDIPSGTQLAMFGRMRGGSYNTPPYAATGVRDGMSPFVSSDYYAQYGACSGGNDLAPSNSSLGNGLAKMWAVGYPWAGVTFKSVTGDVDSMYVMQNILMWLDSTITISGGGSVNFVPYDGPPEIVSVIPVSWENTIEVTKGNTSTTAWYDASTPSNQYPDYTGTDIYRDTPGGAGTNYVVDAMAKVENGLNPNDIDFQFPFYGFWLDPDDSLLAATPVITGDEVWLGRGGLVVEDPDAVWTRIEPQQEISAGGTGGFVDVGPYANWYAFANYDTDLLTPEIETVWANNGSAQVPFAGFYVTGTVPGVTALGVAPDTAIRATYGTDDAHLVFNHDIEPLFFECVAHWPNEQDPGNTVRLEWNLFPGHCTTNPMAYQYGFDIPWSNYVLEQDIDPMVTYSAAAGDTYIPYVDRDAISFMTEIFDLSRGDSSVNNRVVEFDYSLIDGFEGDLDADGTAGEAKDDKFPVRVRLVTDGYAGLNNRTGNYPDHWPDASDSHTGWIEGGCYVASSGTGSGMMAAPTVNAVTYEPYTDATTIMWTGTYPAAPEWTVDITLDVAPYPGNFNVDFSFDVDPLDVEGTWLDSAYPTQTGMQGVNVFTDVTFTDADISGSWINGQQTYLGVKVYQGAGPANYYFCPVPLWLGDVVFWEDFEVDPGVAGWDAGSSSLLFANLYQDVWFYRQGNTQLLKSWATPTQRSWMTAPSPNSGGHMLLLDNGSGGYTYSGSTWNYVLTPEYPVDETTDVFLTMRIHSLHTGYTSWPSTQTCVCVTGYSGDDFYSTAGMISSDTTEVTGNHTVTEADNVAGQVVYVNATQFNDDFHGYSLTDLDGNMRFGHMFYVYSLGLTPGGSASDNWMCTHADLSNSTRRAPFI